MIHQGSCETELFCYHCQALSPNPKFPFSILSLSFTLTFDSNIFHSINEVTFEFKISLKLSDEGLTINYKLAMNPWCHSS